MAVHDRASATDARGAVDDEDEAISIDVGERTIIIAVEQVKEEVAKEAMADVDRAMINVSGAMVALCGILISMNGAAVEAVVVITVEEAINAYGAKDVADGGRAIISGLIEE